VYCWSRYIGLTANANADAGAEAPCPCPMLSHIYIYICINFLSNSCNSVFIWYYNMLLI
jgi:hypothetical protein